MQQQAFEPIYPNPFIAGNPVRSREMFFGREDEFRFIARALEDGRKTALIVLFGERRSGKSSILYQILNRRLGEAFLPFFIDTQIMAGVAGDTEFFSRIITDFCKQLQNDGLPAGRYLAMMKESTATNVFREFLQDLKSHVSGRALLVLIDEYENLEVKIKEGSLSRHVLKFFAGLLETDMVSFVFTGSQTLEAHDHVLWGEELFRKAMSRKIGFLTKDDTTRLITQPVQGKVAFAPEAVAHIYALTAGQPFYTQMICQELVYHLNEEQKYEVTAEDVEKVVAGILENPPPQLLFNWGEHSAERKLALSALAEFSVTPETFLSAPELCRKIARSKLKLDLDANFFNAEFSSLFQEEYLTQKERQYAFRFDLYRQWVRHDHNIWQVQKEIGPARLAQITKTAQVKKEKKKKALKILERTLEAGLALGVIWLVAWLILERKRTVIVQANGGPFSLWVDGDSLGATTGQPDSTRFEIPDGWAAIKNDIFALGSSRSRRPGFKHSLTRDETYTFTAQLIASNEARVKSETIRKDGHLVHFDFTADTLTVITDAASAEIQLGGGSNQIAQSQPEAWQHTFYVCAGDYVLRAKDLQTGEEKRLIVSVPAESKLIKIDFDSVAVLTLTSNVYPFEYQYSLDDARRPRSEPAAARADSILLLRGVPVGAYDFTFINPATDEKLIRMLHVANDTSVSVEFKRKKPPVIKRPEVVVEEPPTGSAARMVDIASDPPGARIFVDGREQGITPRPVPLSDRHHVIKLSKDGYADHSRSIMPGDNSPIHFTLTPQYGHLRLVVQDELGRSLPDVRVFIDNEYLGETPLNEIKLLASRHSLRLYRGSARKDTAVVIPRDDTSKVTLKMMK